MLLGARWVLYLDRVPLGSTLAGRLLRPGGTGFAGFDNYISLFTDDTILMAVKNNS
ncbi:hypothetical protein SBADM41S_04066 [Streptomyces badius]